MKHSELKKQALKRQGVKATYGALELEFFLLRELLKARKKVGLTQAEIAKRMGTKASAITRLESSLSSGQHSPSIATLKKYASALRCHLEIKLIENTDVNCITNE